MEIMVQENDLGYLKYDRAEGPLSGKRLRKREIKADMRGYTSELLAKSIDQGALDKEITSWKNTIVEVQKHPTAVEGPRTEGDNVSAEIVLGKAPWENLGLLHEE